jgi:hypothetical protein
MRILVAERRALAAAILAFYGFLFLLVALAPPPGWGACFAGLAAVYGVGFFALVSGYFWARWYCIGVGLSGLISGAISVWQVGLEPVLLFYGGTHASMAALLWGGAMAATFDGRSEWRERFHLDENATHRLGKAIIRAGVSLPYVIMYALAPREDAGSVLALLAGVALVTFGFAGLVRLRTWGVLALGTAAAVLLTTLGAGFDLAVVGAQQTVDVGATGLAAGLLLLLAVTPFARPIAAYLRR